MNCGNVFSIVKRPQRRQKGMRFRGLIALAWIPPSCIAADGPLVPHAGGFALKRFPMNGCVLGPISIGHAFLRWVRTTYKHVLMRYLFILCFYFLTWDMGRSRSLANLAVMAWTTAQILTTDRLSYSEAVPQLLMKLRVTMLTSGDKKVNWIFLVGWNYHWGILLGVVRMFGKL